MLAIVTWVVGPLLIYTEIDDEIATEHARDAVNWQLSFAIYLLLSVPFVLFGVGLVFLAVLPLINVTFCVIAAVKAYLGDRWAYPGSFEIL